MAINADSVSVGSAPAALRLDRHGAEARQSRWMLELERSTAARAGSPSNAAPRVPSGRQESRAAVISEPAAGPAHARDVSDVGGADGSHVRPGSCAEGVGPHPRMTLYGTHRPCSPIAPSPVSADAGPERAAAAFAGMVTGACRPGQLRPSPQAALTVPAPDAPDVLSQAPTVPEAPAGEWEAAEAASHASAQGERPVFDKRLLNVYVKEDGVHAFIRDSALGAAQARLVVAALSGELAEGGQFLAAVTVNGRLVDAHLADRTSLADVDDGDSTTNNGTDIAHRSQPNFVFKGTPQ